LTVPVNPGSRGFAAPTTEAGRVQNAWRLAD